MWQKQCRLYVKERHLGNTDLVLNPHFSDLNNRNPEHGMDFTKVSQLFTSVNFTNIRQEKYLAPCLAPCNTNNPYHTAPGKLFTGSTHI
jgi:hypothetical protein